MNNTGNLFESLPEAVIDEQFEKLFENNQVLIERIVSFGQSTPKGEWLSQNRAEWVILLTGSALLFFEDKEEIITMKAGDYIYIPPNSRHRVEMTDKYIKTVWLAVHFEE